MLSTNICAFLSAQIELEGSLQAYVHNATKYDECELANFPHVKTCLTCHWVCVGKEPHNHHAVRRCAPDKMPVLPDKQVRMYMYMYIYTGTMTIPFEHSTPLDFAFQSYKCTWIEMCVYNVSSCCEFYFCGIRVVCAFTYKYCHIFYIHVHVRSTLAGVVSSAQKTHNHIQENT